MIQLAKPAVQFDRDKLVEAAHYICTHADRDKLSNVKFHKILYYADMLHFAEHGNAITGVDYIKQKFGPVARHLTWAIDSLEKEGFIKTYFEDYYGFRKKTYESLKPYTPKRLSREEQSVLDEFIDFVGNKSANEISELSHNEAWRSVSMGETIGYHTVYRLFPSPIDDEDVEWATETAKSHAAETPRQWA